MENKSFDNVAWLLGNPITNFCMNIVDESVKMNSEFHYQAGISATVERVVSGETCKWCQARAGKFVYPDVPKETWQRHENCDCLIFYKPKHSKTIEKHVGGEGKSWVTSEEYDIIRERAGLISHSDAKTIDEARKYLKDTLGIDEYQFDKINIDVANTLNREIATAFDLFPKIKESGEITQIRVMPKLPKDAYAAYQRITGYLMLDKRNVAYKNSLKKMLQDALDNYRIGAWSTGKAEHSIRHELGHAVDASYNARNNPKIIELFKAKRAELGIDDALYHRLANGTATRSDVAIIQKAGKSLSGYGFKSVDEFIAESVAEYMAGDPRQIATEVIGLILS